MAKRKGMKKTFADMDTAWLRATVRQLDKEKRNPAMVKRMRTVPSSEFYKGYTKDIRTEYAKRKMKKMRRVS